MQAAHEGPRIAQVAEHVEAEDRADRARAREGPGKDMRVLEVAGLANVEAAGSGQRRDAVDHRDPARAAVLAQPERRCPGAAADIEQRSAAGGHKGQHLGPDAVVISCAWLPVAGHLQRPRHKQSAASVGRRSMGFSQFTRCESGRAFYPGPAISAQ
jgi:hypothetical protein